MKGAVQRRMALVGDSGRYMGHGWRMPTGGIWGTLAAAIRTLGGHRRFRWSDIEPHLSAVE